MDINTGKLRRLETIGRLFADAMDEYQKQRRESEVLVSEDQLTEKQKEEMQVSKYDNRSELGKLYLMNRRGRRKLLAQKIAGADTDCRGWESGMMNERRLDRLVVRIRLAIVRAACRLLLPRNVWVGMHFGAYTQKWSVHLGRLDCRGVLQGISDRDAGA